MTIRDLLELGPNCITSEQIKQEYSNYISSIKHASNYRVLQGLLCYAGSCSCNSIILATRYYCGSFVPEKYVGMCDENGKLKMTFMMLPV